MSGNQAPNFGKDPLTPCHGDSLVDQSFQSLKSKEIRDSMSPPHDLKFHSLTLNQPSTTGWDVQTSSEVSPDGRAYRTETVAKTDGVEKIKGGTADFKGRNEQRASASHQGDDKNFVKKASESSNTHLQENVVIGDENSGRTEMKMSSTSTSSSSQVISSSSNTDVAGADPIDTKYLMDSSNRNQQQQQRMTQDQYEKQFQQQRQQHQQDRSLQDQYEQKFQQKHQQQEHLTTQQQKQQTSEEYNRNRQESSSSRNVETRQETEQSRRVVDMDKASPEYQQHVQFLMAQPGEVISSTVEYPKPNVKMITTVKRLPDGTIVKNKRYETEELRPSLETSTHQRTTSSTNQSNTQHKTDRRQQKEENIYSRQQNTDHRQNAPSRRPNADVVDNKQQLIESYPSDRNTEDVSTSFSTVKKSSRRFSTETTSETIEETDDRSPSSKPVSSRHVIPDFSTHGFPSVKPNKPTQEYVGERPHAPNDFTTHGFPSVKPNKLTQEFPTEHPHSMRSTDVQHVTTQGSPVVRTIKTPDGEVIVISSETSRSQKYNTNSERVVETEVVTDSGNYPSSGPGSHGPAPITYTISPNKPSDFTTHGFPSVKESSPMREGTPSREYPGSPRRSHPTEDFSTHGFPSVRSPTKTEPEVFVVSSESRHSANRKANTEHIIKTEVITDGDYPTHGQRPEQIRYIPPTKPNDFSTHGFPSVRDSLPLHEGPPGPGTSTRDYPSSPRRSQPTEDFSTHGFPSVRSPTKTTPGYARPKQTSPQRKPTRTSPTRKSTNVETTKKVVHKEKETDAAHRAFAASLRSSSPVDNQSQTDHHRHTPRSSISSTKPLRRDLREGSHDSTTAPSETSRISSSTVTRQSPSKNVGKTVVTKQTVVKTRNVNGSNETIDLTPQRSTTKSPSPGKTTTTTTTKTTTTTNNKTPQTITTTAITEEVPKPEKSPYSPAPSTIHKSSTHQPKNKSPTRDIVNNPENYEPSSSSDIEPNYRNRSPSKPKESSPKFVRHPPKDATSVERRTVVRETTFEKIENESNFPVDHDNPEYFVQPKERVQSPTRPKHTKQFKQAEFEIVSVPKGKTPDAYDSPKKPNEPINKPTNKKPGSPKPPVHSVKKTVEKTEVITDRKEKFPDRNIPKNAAAPRQPIQQKPGPQKTTPYPVDNDDENHIVGTDKRKTVITEFEIITDSKSKTPTPIDRNTPRGLAEPRKPSYTKPGAQDSTPYLVDEDDDGVVTTIITETEIITDRKGKTSPNRDFPKQEPASKKLGPQKSVPYPNDNGHFPIKPKTRNENTRVDDLFQHTHKTKQTKNINEEFITTERDNQRHRPRDDESPDGGFISKNHSPEPTIPTSPTFKKKGLSQRETFEERCRHILGMEDDGDTQGAYKKHPDIETDTDDEPIKKEKPQENIKKDTHNTIFEVKIEDCDDDEPLYISNVKKTLETRNVSETPKGGPVQPTLKTVTDSEKLLESERISKPYSKTGTPFGNDFEEVIVTFTTDHDTTHKHLTSEASDHLKKTSIRKTPERKQYPDDKPDFDDQSPDAIRKQPNPSHPRDTTTEIETTMETEILRSKSPEQKKPKGKPYFDDENPDVFKKSPSPTSPRDTTTNNKKTTVVTDICRSKSPEQKKPESKPEVFRKSPSPATLRDTTTTNKKTTFVAETRRSKSPHNTPDFDDEKPVTFRKSPSPTRPRDTTNKKTTVVTDTRRSKSPHNTPDFNDEKPVTFRKSPSPTRPRDTTYKKTTVVTDTRRSKSPYNKPDSDDEKPLRFRKSPSPTRVRETTTVVTETRRSKSPYNKPDFVEEKPDTFRKSPNPTKPRDFTTSNKITTVVTEIRGLKSTDKKKPTKLEPKITDSKPVSKLYQTVKPEFDNKKPISPTKPRETMSFIKTSTILSESRRPKSPEQRKPTKLEPETSFTSESESPDRESDVDTEKENFISEKYIKCTEKSTIEKRARTPSPEYKRKSPEKPIHNVPATKPTSISSSPTRDAIKRPEQITSSTRKQPITKEKHVGPVDQPKFKTTSKFPIKPVSKIVDETNIEITEKHKTSRISTTPNAKSKNIIPEKDELQPSNRPQGKIPSKYPITTRKESEKFVEETKTLRQPRKPSVESPTSTIKDRLRSSPRKQTPKTDDVDAVSSSPDTSPNRYTERRRSSNISVHTEIIIDHAGPKSPKQNEPLLKKQPHSPKQSHSPKPSSVKDLINSTLSEKPNRKFPVTERKESAPVHRVTHKDKDVKMSRSTSENVIKVTDKQLIKHPEMSCLSPKSSRRPNKCFTTKTINLTTHEQMINSEDMENVIIDIQQAKSSREPSPDKIVPTPVPIGFDTGKPRYPDVVQEPEDEPRRKPIVKNIPIFEEDTNEFVGCQISEIKIDKFSKNSDYTDYNEILVNPTIEAPPSLEYPSIDRPDDDCLLSVHEKVSKFTHTAEEIRKPKASSPFSREFDETPRVPDDDDCLLSVDQKVNKFIRTAETITKPSVTPVREIERPNFDDIDEELRQDDCTLSVSQKVNKFINTAEKLAPTAPQRSPELVARIERSISRQSEPEYPDESSDNEPLIPFSENHTIEIEKKRQKDILSRPSTWQKNNGHNEIINATNYDSIPTTEVHSTTIEINRNQKRTDFEPNKIPRKPQSPVLKRSSITDKTKCLDNTEETEITTEFTAGPSDFEPNKVYPRKPQSPVFKRSSLTDKTKHFDNLEQTEITTEITAGSSDFEPNQIHPRKPQSPVLKSPSITDKAKRFVTTEQTKFTTEKINSRYVKPVNDVKPETTVAPKTTRKDAPTEATKVSQPKAYTKYNTSTVSTTRSRFETPKADTTQAPRRKPSAESVSPKKTQPQNGQPKLVPKRKPSTGPETQDSETEIEIEEIEYQTTDTETELTSHRRSSTKTVEHSTTTNGRVSPQKGTPNNRIIAQGKYKKPEEVSHSPTNTTPQKSTKTTITRITERTLNHMPPSQQHPDTEFVEPILEKPKPSPFSPIGRSKVITETVAARRNIFEKNAVTSKSHTKPSTPVQTGRRPSYMDHTKSSLEHGRRDSLEVNKNNYSRKSSVEDDTQYEKRPNAAVKFDVPQRPRKEPSVSEDINIEEIFDLAILEHMLEIVTSYELRRRIRAQIRLVKKNTLNTQTVDKKKSETKTSTSISSTHKSSSIYSSKMHHEETDSFSDDIHSKKPYESTYSPKRTTKPQHKDDMPIRDVRYKQPRDRSLSPQQPSKLHQKETVTIRETKYSNKPHDRSQSPMRPSRMQHEETDTTSEGQYIKKLRDHSHSPEAKTISSSMKEVRRVSGSSNQYTRKEQVDYSSEEVVSSPIPERKRIVDSSRRQPHERSYSPEYKPTTTPSYQKSKSPEYPTNPKTLDRSSSPESKTKPQPYKSQPQGRSTSPQSKTTSEHEESYVMSSKKTIKTTHSPEQAAPERKPSKSKPEEKTPVWADRKNILKNQSTTPTTPRKAPFCATTRPTTSATKTAVKTNTTQQQRQRKTNEEDSIISSYGIGPTDENGLPLFGIRALKKKKPQPCEATEVTGYVVEEKYYADSKTKPIVERKEYIYSTDADGLEKIKKTVESRKSSNDDAVVRQFKKIDKEFINNEPKAIMPESEDFATSSTKYVRRGSVKEMSEKFIRKESSQSITEKSSSSYPKAGLILRTGLGGGTTTDAGDCFETSEHFTTTTTGSGTRYRPDNDDEEETTDGDYEMQMQHSSRMLNESESECESMSMKREMSSSKKSSKSSSSTRSFLNSSGDTKIVTGVDDVLQRMRNADNVVEAGDTAEDQEARALLNKFLGASVIMRGVESVLPQTKQTKTTTTTTYANNGDNNLKNQEVKTTRVTKTIKSGSSSSPVTRTTCDIEEIWDEEILKELLEQASTYEERRKIRARLRELMAEREDQHAAATSTTQKTETKEKDGAVVTTTTKVTTHTVSGGAAPKQVSPFSKFRQLDKQNSQQSKSTPSTPTTPGGSASSSGSTRIFQFTDPALNARAATVKDQLLQWCQMKTQEYENVQITNFSTSWSDGLAFCALIHHFLPDAFDYSKLTPQSRRHNFTLAFTVADEKAGIAPLLDVEDMVVMKRPDWKCVFIYCQAIYVRFRNCQ